jgi:hypothetical protein
VKKGRWNLFIARVRRKSTAWKCPNGNVSLEISLHPIVDTTKDIYYTHIFLAGLYFERSESPLCFYYVMVFCTFLENPSININDENRKKFIRWNFYWFREVFRDFCLIFKKPIMKCFFFSILLEMSLQWWMNLTMFWMELLGVAWEKRLRDVYDHNGLSEALNARINIFIIYHNNHC